MADTTPPINWNPFISNQAAAKGHLCFGSFLQFAKSPLEKMNIVQRENQINNTS